MSKSLNPQPLRSLWATNLRQRAPMTVHAKPPCPRGQCTGGSPFSWPGSSLSRAAFWHRSGTCHFVPFRGGQSSHTGLHRGHSIITGHLKMQWPCAQQSRVQASHFRPGSRGAMTTRRGNKTNLVKNKQNRERVKKEKSNAI